MTDSFVSEGVDFYRALLDTADFFRNRLVADLSDQSAQAYPEQSVRILDALQAGEDLVRTGLSEKTNFEVTMFRAIEAGKTRSIDQLIRRISGILPEELKKKTESSLAVETKVVADDVPSSPPDEDLGLESSKYDSKTYGSDLVQSTPVAINHPSEKRLLEKSETGQGSIGEPTSQFHEGMDDQVVSSQEKNPDRIEERITSLPPALRNLLQEKFRGRFVAIEKINRDLFL